MRCLLRLGRLTVIIVLALLVVVSRLGIKPTQTGQPRAAIEKTTAPTSSSRPHRPTATAAQTVVPLAYDVATDEMIEAPNGRTRDRRDIVISESGPPERVAATLADAVRQGLANHPTAIVGVVFGYGPDDAIGSGFTRGRASASRDGKGLDPGSAQLLAGPDPGQIQIEVATDWSEGIPTETKIMYLPLD
jgi:hypothetical protein